MSRISRVCARIDVRLSLAVGACAALLMSIALVILLSFAVMESLEEKDAEIARSAEVVATQGGGELHLPRDLVTRARDRSGRVSGGFGTWPSSGRAVEVGMWSSLRASRRDYLTRTVSQADGSVVELALPLHHFVHERSEVFRAAARILLASLLATSLFGVFAARRALEPLRRATREVLRVDEQHLDARLPVRGGGDDVDALAAAVNQVLERLEWTFRRMAAFSADVAHELRTPVNRMINSTEVALLAPGAAKSHDDALVVVHDTAEEMARLIEQLLLLARGDEGRLAMQWEEFDAALVVRRLVELYEPVAEASDQALSFRSAPVHVRADARLLQRAVGNLIENALRHTPRGGAIQVAVAECGQLFEVVVDDSGPGIPTSERERIFERFAQLDPARRAGGAGLGLSIASMIVRLHGGELRVEDSVLGGARFRVILRRLGVDLIRGPSRETEQAARARSSRRRGQVSASSQGTWV